MEDLYRVILERSNCVPWEANFWFRNVYDTKHEYIELKVGTTLPDSFTPDNLPGQKVTQRQSEQIRNLKLCVDDATRRHSCFCVTTGSPHRNKDGSCMYDIFLLLPNNR